VKMKMNQRILEIDCEKREIHTKSVPGDFELLGGRGFTSTFIGDEVDPAAHPLGDGNVMVMATGLMAGSTLSSANRLSAGAKSPLTGGIKESNCGGVASYKLGRLGVRALVFRGCPADGGGAAGVESAVARRPGKPEFLSMGLKISKEGASLEDLSFVKGTNTYEASRLLLERYGKKVGLMLIGSAGEMGLPTACINITDMDGEPCRNLGRGGLGAVMGSKGIKAIIIDDDGCPNPYAKDEEVKRVIKEFSNKLRAHPVTGENFALYGTCMVLQNVNALGGLPTRNFSEGVFEGAEAIGAQSLHDTIESRGGMSAHSCMPGCVIRCSNKYVRPDGSPFVGSLDYETICLLGSNIGLSDHDQIAELNYLCNDIGVDTIETGAALGVLAEGDVFSFGDFEAARSIIGEIGDGTPLGRLVGSGSVSCGRAYGVRHVPAVKNQGMAAYDPRAIKGMGVTYAQSPMGADHTAGNAILLDLDHQDPNAQLEPVRDLNINITVLDMLGVCFFTGRVSLGETSIVEEIVYAFTGKKLSFEELRNMAKRVLIAEREFNRKSGLGKETDRLPEFMMREPLSSTRTVFDVPEEQMDSFYDFPEEASEEL